MFNRRTSAGPIGRGGTALATTAGARRKSPTLFPPHLYPPVGSIPIFESNTVASVGPANTVHASVVETVLPQGRAGVVRVVQGFIDSPGAATVIQWRVRVNGIVYQGLKALTIIGRAAASIAKTWDQWAIEIPEGGRITIDIVNVDGAARTLGTQLEGWHYAIEEAYGR